MGVFKKHEDRDQGLLFPPSPRDWLPEGHLAWFPGICWAATV